MNEAVFIFPHHLFEDHPCLKRGRTVFLIEDRRFFSDFLFHKQKLVFHRASLKSYQNFLEEKGYTTVYIEGDLEDAFEHKKISSLHLVDIDDVEVEKRVHACIKKFGVKLEVVKSPLFLTGIDEFKEFFKGKNHFSCDTFYIYQRRKLHILIDEMGKPVGGKWSFDKENRRKLPKSINIPNQPLFGKSNIVKKSVEYVEKKYLHHLGTSDHFVYATTHEEAKHALKDFLENRLYFFGDYEDAIDPNEGIIFHSALSMLINVGLLTPNQVVQETIAYANKNEIPLNSLEGFIRQVIGWREFIRGVYHIIGEKQRTGNFFHHKRKMPKVFYEGTSGILPLDHAIDKLLKTAYLHHIERLMLLGNFFLLSEISPDEIYRWFMELFIDSYDWVMVPNVYGMSQYADGGMMTTKPYFSGSNYILKMSSYKKGDWSEIWDALFWRFMIKHLPFFEKQPRLSILYDMAKKKKSDTVLLAKGEQFLKESF
ncbi:MAG: cryptochrome/photolyase family protein [Chlamydiae bacterium]|jgi:deoxyribodipyrimidine photolyase-related protein|nr:cryptochrome/photolyase family protein [Chlamydiota bacterium]